MVGTVNTSFLHLVAAFFIAFILAHITTKYFERFERFPSPLVAPGPGVPPTVQGRDYIPYRTKPTPPPGPDVPIALESDRAIQPVQPVQPVQTVQTVPYAKPDDDYFNFMPPNQSLTMAPFIQT